MYIIDVYYRFVSRVSMMCWYWYSVSVNLSCPSGCPASVLCRNGWVSRQTFNTRGVTQTNHADLAC